MAAHTTEVHHAAPRCLLRLHEDANAAALDGAGIEAWLSWEEEATRWSVPVEISREDLAALVEVSAVALERSEHRRLHENDWQRWGRRGGLRTLALYGRGWFALLARRRWGRIELADLEAARALR